MGFFWWSSGWGCICQCRWHRFYPCSVSIPRAVGQLTPHTRPHFRAFELHSCWARIPRARTPPQEKPPRWKACTRQLKKARAKKWRSRRTIKKRKKKKKKPALYWWFGGLVTQSCPTRAIPWTVTLQAPLSMGFSRQEYWSGLPFPSPGDLLCTQINF